MNLEAAIEKLRNDEDYYGDFGKQFLSNSDIKTLLSDPTKFHQKIESTSALIVGSYFHTAILEPDKLHRFKIIEASSRNTNHYKDLSEGEMCMLQHEADMVEAMKSRLLANDTCRGLIQGEHADARIEYEVPNIIKLGDNYWKGKADIVNHDEKLIIDLKTTSDLEKFQWSAKTYNYDSQAYIYSQMFGYDFLFIVIDKKTLQIGLFDCSPEFYQKGLAKVEEASLAYDLYVKDENFKPENYFITKTL